MGYNPKESLENTINTMGTLLGVHPTVPWTLVSSLNPLQQWVIQEHLLEIDVSNQPPKKPWDPIVYSKKLVGS